ncbi:MAG TPA: transcriptional regulator GcvA [Candidatus Accumulibacter phosphatis]|nr:MAG: Gcv operon activator [Candidatus Accumulibacter sp. SK-11]HAY26871.1 XRE family transcriptional regulator [Accumulibacter sp.]HCV12437.1 XRE family transcriptional regulator [Accumulibacter sp.]HRL78101.1 transcriptional regulator GcvA [Candidatus Accumulibacter phosphatis]HRQ96875.1 transcriptional regulator GcvA [Candidatus Accumulibacter phosphatis]
MADQRRTPVLGSLRVFVAAARTQSVTGAAAQLHLTHGAVSHQLRQLQDQLGIALFERHGRGLRLTANGAVYAEELARAFADIDQATDRLLANCDYRRLRVSCMPSFAARWLLPRLGNFIARHPEYDVEVQSSARLADIKGGEADVALRFGHGRYPGLSCRLLMRDWYYPVCSPEFRHRHQLASPSQLISLPLLRSPDEHWQPWFSAAGLVVDEPQRGAVFDDSSLMLMAAASGQGVALARHTLAVDDLASGRLLRPFTTIIESPLSYYLVSRPADEQQPAVVSFRDWLVQEAASYRPPAGEETPTAGGQRDESGSQ